MKLGNSRSISTGSNRFRLRLSRFATGTLAAAALAAPTSASAQLSSLTSPGTPTVTMDNGTAVITAGVGGGNYQIVMSCVDNGNCPFTVGLTNGTAGPKPIMNTTDCFAAGFTVNNAWNFTCTHVNRVKVTFGNGADKWSVGPGVDILQDVTVYGGGGNDRLDMIDSQFASARLFGQAGNDRLAGAFRSPNVLSGGAGADDLLGGLSQDDLRGGAGNDHLDGDGGDNVLEGDAGDDFLMGNEGSDTIDGGTGNDKIYGYEGVDLLMGGDGADKIDIGPPEGDTAMGGAANDVIWGQNNGPTPPHFFGNSGNDQLYASSSGDASRGSFAAFLVGGEGNDTLYAANGYRDQTIDCGDGTGDISFEDPGPERDYDSGFGECEKRY
jgi:Ca2+-binding RTX toxin-like protein